MRCFNALVFCAVGLFMASPHVRAQDTPTPSATLPASASNAAEKKIDNPSEVSKFKETCGNFQIKEAGGCAELLLTGKPVHIAVGSLAPQNGFGAGLAYVGYIHPSETWRPSWNADAVGTPNGSWRAGVYFKFVHTPPFTTTVLRGKPKKRPNTSELPEHAVVNVYAQATSLNKLAFFGLGPETTRAGRSYFGTREVIAGSSVVKPFASRWNLSLLGEANGRFVDIRQSNGQASPSIGSLYDETSAPGLTNQPGFFQLGEAIRMRPVFWDDFLHLNYAASYQQFFAPSKTTYSFQRFTVDLAHDFALYRSTTDFHVSRDANGPDECSTDSSNNSCGAISRNLQGSIGFRFFLSTSFTQGRGTVPFYFQPTLGGGDINGSPSLASYQDYRFRAPNVMLLRESFEHSIWGPLGFALSADEGKVALQRGDLGSNPWLHSFSTGLTLRAGGFPQVFLLFSWGGDEGTHTIANVNTSLLGGSARPSLF